MQLLQIILLLIISVIMLDCIVPVSDQTSQEFPQLTRVFCLMKSQPCSPAA